MEISEILKRLNQNPIENAWAIQDLMLWPERTQIFYSETVKGFSYLLISGHPSQVEFPMVILCDAGGDVETLFKHLPKGPFIVRETRASVVEKLRPFLGQAKVYYEYRMDLVKAKARLPKVVKARRLTESEAQLLAKFQGAPPHVEERMKMWIRGAVIMAIFHQEQIVSMGSTIVRTADVWDLVAIETAPEFRRRGYATDVVAALSIEAFKNVDAVTLTVLKENIAAINTYTKLGFEIKEDRVWIDFGTGAKP